MTAELVLSQRVGAVMHVTLNRPEVRNAINPDVAESLALAVEAAAADEAIRVLRLAGAGVSFCAGGDADYKGGVDNWAPIAHVFHAIRDCPKPVVARVQRHAIGFGCTLALLADFVVAGSDARLHFPFIQMGLVPEGTREISHRLPPAVARSFVLLGEPLSGEEAQSWGLIYRAVEPDVLDEAVADLEARLLEVPTPAMARAKQGLLYAEEHTAVESFEMDRVNQSELRNAPGYAEFRAEYFRRKGVGRRRNS